MSASDLGFSGLTFDASSDGWDSGSLGPADDVQHVTIVEGCGCAMCAGLRDAGTDGVTAKGGINTSNPESGNIGVLLNLHDQPGRQPLFTGNRNVDATLIGSKWGTHEPDLTASRPRARTTTAPASTATASALYHLDLGPQQQAAARAAFAQLSAVTGLTFTEITETDTVHANIRISQSADNDVASAYGGFPSDTRGVAGDIWFGRTSQPYYDLACTGHVGLRHDDARDRPHDGAEARAPGLHQQRPVVLLRHLPAFRHPVADRRIATARPGR